MPSLNLTWIWRPLAAVAVVLLLLQTWRLGEEEKSHQKLITSMSQKDTARAKAELKAEVATSADERTHATQTQENSDAFTQFQPARDVVRRADFDRVERLRLDAVRRAASYRAQALANAAACSNLADRLEAFDGHIVRGTGVVAGLRADLERRDAEVALQQRQIQIDRRLMAP